MDGNGRWAKNKGLPRLAGHKAGVERLKEIVEATINCNVSFLTLYAFSSENWNRPKLEINDLMNLLETFLNKEAKKFLKENIRLRVIGRRDRLNRRIIDKIKELEINSDKNDGLNLIIALDYGGREDIRSAIINIYNDFIRKNKAIERLTLEEIENNLMTKGIPNPDLIIRTSGEYRISNFLLWQSAYSEYEFVSCNWPDFNTSIYIEVLKNFENRDRRYGQINEY
ncbi:MAG: di-trans,poly-cis-decaprenylcistransferase [Alphaproteobacteria bacterium]|nr:di-trans,poly-cis-decaprenylcistransferase [Pelagibacterales bacterium]MAW58280.1 di-trans,poly-cis-decaprenylcistransferase [Alphaproteobacteria bacterium]OUV27546.1 MAG: di-trans,poly-cis-decaprenylcistransferase [Alphaproteobacteria bacterium TMED109]|tara:strand:- start:1433 stop:2110 length:678 start_codon:yes stop_codon:yes gene_type:complete